MNLTPPTGDESVEYIDLKFLLVKIFNYVNLDV
jgi:hypothetical protein